MSQALCEASSVIVFCVAQRPASATKGQTSFNPGRPSCCALAPSVRWDGETHSSFPSLGLRSQSVCPVQVLVLSSTSKKASAVGDVVNLVSVDIQRLVEFTLYVNALWLTVIWTVVCFVYLWQVCRSSQTPGHGCQWL